MSLLVAHEVKGATENWDDDFEFQPAEGNTPQRSPGTSRRKESLLESLPPLSRDTKNTINLKPSLQQWAEPGPSTPSKRIHTQTENWDDDFQDTRDSPIRHHTVESSPRSRRGRRRPSIPYPENWDDDFEVDDKHASPSGKSARWDTSDDEAEEHGFGERDEDRTVTSRARRGGLPRSPFLSDTPPPPVPPIPSGLSSSRMEPTPFPRSPTLSAFSVPGSVRESVAHSYSSTAHLALRTTPSGSSLGALPPSPPMHHARERRRLRKKSRPARVEANIYEMDDRVDVPLRPATPDRGEMEDGITSASETMPDPAPPSAGKSSLVSRIGSVGRKWGASRRKRASTGPAEVTAQEGSSSSRPASVAIASSPSSSAKSWFFRHGGAHGAGSGSPPSQTSALPLKHEKSVDRLLALVGLDHDTPARTRRKDKMHSSSDLSGAVSDSTSASFLFGPPKRPVSMQVTPSSKRSSHNRLPRHASYGQSRDASSSRSSLAAWSISESMEKLTRKRSRGPVSREDVRTPKGPGHRSSQQGPESRSSSDSPKLSSKSKHSRTQSRATATSGGSSEGPRHSTSTTATAIPRHIPDRSDDVTPRPSSRIKGRPSTERDLLPPIELQPPSPPRTLASDGLSIPNSGHIYPISNSEHIYPVLPAQEPPTPDFRLSQSTSSGGLQIFMSSSASSSVRQKPSTSPQSASLGRSAPLPRDVEPTGTMPRRSSLGDLKIPERISQAQISVRRDLGMVREFAASIDRLKDLQTSYQLLMSEVQAFLVETLPPEPPKNRTVSPTLFGLPRPLSRARSYTDPQAVAPPSTEEANHKQSVAMYRSIEARYRLTWECADLLIELGGGSPATAEPLPASLLPSNQTATSFEGRKSRDRAITLSGEESKPHVLISNMSHTTLPLAHHPSGASHWRASTGRHDLSQRQLMLLRDMLSSPDTSLVLAKECRILEEEVNRDWRWGDAMNSTITLPTEESSQAESDAVGGTSPAALRRRKSGRLGMRGLRDMLRSLKKTYSSSPSISQESQQGRAPTHTNLPVSSLTDVSVCTTSSLNLPQRPETTAQRGRAKTNAGKESIRSVKDHPNSPYAPPSAASLGHHTSPRRPSLASIFRLGQKNKSTAKPNPQSGASDLMAVTNHADAASEQSAAHGIEDEDWDEVESSADCELTSASSTVRAEKSGTVKGRRAQSPYSLQNSSPRQGSNPSRSSIWTLDPPRSPPYLEASMGSPASGEGQTWNTKLSNVPEVAERDSPQKAPSKRLSWKARRGTSAAVSPSPKRPRSRASKVDVATSGSIRSRRHGGSSEVDAAHANLQDTALTLAMTPENIKPLLENAKEVQARCKDCLEELRRLLDSQQQV